MKNRLNLTIDPGVLHRARSIARERNTSLSAMVEELLAGAAGPPESELSVPFSERWRGKLKVERRDDPRFEHLARKYDLE